MKKVIITIALLLVCVNVKALSIKEQIDINGKYKNENGVVIEKQNYEKIKGFLDTTEIDSIDNKIYNEINNSKEIVGIKTAIVESVYSYVGDKKIKISENILTLKEYNRRNSILADTLIGNEHHETEYKHIWYQVTKNSKGQYHLYIQNSWIKSPDCKSFDVLAFRWEGDVSIIYTSANGSQNYYQTRPSPVDPPEIQYDDTSNNFKFLYNGVGLSQNLVNDANYYTSTMQIDIECSGKIDTFATYQHAQKDVTLAQSRAYILNSSGLGKVLYYTDYSIESKYDNTAGLEISFTA